MQEKITFKASFKHKVTFFEDKKAEGNKANIQTSEINFPMSDERHPFMVWVIQHHRLKLFCTITQLIQMLL